MTDDLDRLPERKAAEKVSAAKHQRAVAKLRDRWAREGFDPRAHLTAVTACGDPEVLRTFTSRERDAETRSFTSRLARQDIYDVAHAIWAAGAAERHEAQRTAP